MIPYFFKQIRKRLALSLALIFMSAAFAFAFGIIEGSSRQMGERIEEVRRFLPVRWSVTNPQGTQQNDLSITEDLLALFRADPEQEKDSFRPYIHKMLFSTQLLCNLDDDNVRILGISKDDLLPQSIEVTWGDDYDIGEFGGSGMWVLAPEGTGETVTLDFYYVGNMWPQEGRRTIPVTFTVAGTHTGKDYYMPFNAGLELSYQLWGRYTAQHISGVFKNNLKIDEFWETLGSKYFLEPSPKYDSNERKLGFAIYDELMIETIEKLQQNQTMLSLASVLLMVVSFGVGFVFSFLTLRNRIRELWLCYILGMGRIRILWGSLAEHMLLSLMGIGIGAGTYKLFLGPPSSNLPLFFVVSLLGTAIAEIITMQKKFLETGGE